MDLSVFNRSSKLKWDRTTILLVVFLAITFIYIPVLIWEGERYGTTYTSLVWGGVIILFGFLWLFMVYIPLVRIKVIVFILYLIIGTMTWHYPLKEMEGTFFTENTYNAHLILFLVVTILSVPYLFWVKKRIKVHFRKIFELAARPLNDVQNGFTGRPYPVGKWQYTMHEIKEFSRYLQKNMIAFPRYYDGKTILSFSAKMVDPRKQDPEKSSFISFDISGNITVNIAKDDYDQYKENFTFDQLCHSLSEVFKDLFEKYKNGEKESIIKIMESFEPKWVKYVQVGTVILFSIGFIFLVILYFLKR